MRNALFAVLLLASPVSADETAAFLKVGVGARAVGMAGAYTAVANDVNSIAWNPAGLAVVPKSELGATHAELATGIRYDYLGFAQPTRYGTLGVAGGYLSQGALDARDETGKATGGFTAADSVVNVGYAARFDSSLRLGGNVKYVKSRIANVSAQSYALDFGGQYALTRTGPGVPTLGVAVQNLGPGMRFLDQTAALPMTVAAGVGYQLPLGLTLAADFKHRPNSRYSEFAIGTEYALFSSFALRSGYSSAAGAQSLPAGRGASTSPMSGFAAGFGLKAFGYTLDYSMTPFGELGNVQRFSLGARW